MEVSQVIVTIGYICRFLIVLSVLVFVHELGHFWAAVRAGIRVEVFSLGFGKKLFRFNRKGTEYAISSIPLGGYVKLAGDTREESKGGGDEFLGKPVGKRFNVIAAGPVMNYIFGFVFFWIVFCMGFPVLGTTVKTVKEGMGAANAGIVSGDKIVAIGQTPVSTWDEMTTAIQGQQSNKEVAVVVERAGSRMTLPVVLAPLEAADMFGKKTTFRGIGISPDVNQKKILKYGFARSGIEAARKTWQLTALTYKALWYMITGKLSARKSVAGPVAMYDIFSQVRSFVEILILMAVVSISLGIFNLLPLPALDGGHIVLLGIEKIRGKYLSKRAEEIFNQVGFVFLISVGVLVLVNDLANKGVFGDIVTLFQKLFHG